MAETSGAYVYDQAWKEERERLAGMERLWDPGTQAIIEPLGLSSGWSCLEVGAGAGSIAEWLADRVGPEGSVLATDVSTRYLRAVERPNLEVREHDVLRDPLPEEHFDLIHARLVVEHLGRAALDRMLPALRPGGWLVLEDYSFAAAGVDPPNELFERITEVVIEFMSRAGFDSEYGRKLVHELEAVGLQDVDARGRARVYRGGTPGTAFIRLSLEALRDRIVAAGQLADEEIEEGLAAVDDPGNVFVSPLMVAAWGRKSSPPS
jgi:SAM-dependent methyltransferase